METVAEKIQREIDEERAELRVNMILTLVTFVGLIAAVVIDWLDGPTILLVIAYVAAYLAGGLPATKEALGELWEGSLGVDMLMVLAALAAAAVGEPRDGAILLFLFSLAGTLEGYAMGNTKRSIASLMELRPDKARRKNAAGETEEVAVEKLTVGDVIVVRPGERIAIDGEIVTGRGAIDQSSVTGESVPVDKEPEDQVFAGTLNQNALLHIKVTSPAEQSTLARMIELVTEAQETKSPSERFSDWFGERYTIAVLVGSALSLGLFYFVLGIPFADAAYKSATLLVVASPCAIVISVPAAVLSALATAARNGVLFKGGAALEDLSNVHAVAFDKTGTLTHGVLKVTNVQAFSGTEDEVLAIARTVEEHSDHPLAKSIVAYAVEKDISTHTDQETETIAGKGIVTITTSGERYWVGNIKLVEAEGATLAEEEKKAINELEADGKTPVIVGVGAKLRGVIGLADTMRESAGPLCNELRKLGVQQCKVLTGDTQLVAESIGAQGGFSKDDIHGALLPEDKVQVVKDLQEKHRVAFIGDGINDAAALATAQVGIAMGTAGSDVALEAADVALLSDDLNKISYAYKLSHRANRIIKQNLIFAVGIMALMIVVTIGWYLPLPLGVVGHEGGTLLVVANSLRLLFMKVE